MTKKIRSVRGRYKSRNSNTKTISLERHLALLHLKINLNSEYVDISPHISNKWPLCTVAVLRHVDYTPINSD